MKFSLGEICETIGAGLEGNPEMMIEGVSTLQETNPARICFAEDKQLLDQVRSGSAGGVIVDRDFPDLPGHRLLRVENPRHAFIRVTEMFLEPAKVEGIHPAASVHDSAQLDGQVTVGACATLGADACIGELTTIQSGAQIAPGVVIGRECLIEANAVLLDGVTLGDRVLIHAGAVIGGEGFGFVWMKDHHHKVPQIGTVVIEDDVEIGCNSCVDRATLGVTRISRGTKIDNLVQVGHNDQVGEHVIICGHVAIGGSVTLGNGVMIGGAAALRDHVSVGDGAIVGGTAAVAGSVSPGESVLGIPARPVRKARREIAAIPRLPELLKAFSAQKKELEALKGRVAELEGNGTRANDGPSTQGVK